MRVHFVWTSLSCSSFSCFLFLPEEKEKINEGRWGLQSQNSDGGGNGGVKHAWSFKEMPQVVIQWNILWAFENKRKNVKRMKREEDSGWKLKSEVKVYVTVSKPQELQRKAVNRSSPCLNRLWTVLPCTTNHRSSWRLLGVRALTRCLPPDQGADAGRREWKRQKEVKNTRWTRRKGGVKKKEKWDFRCFFIFDLQSRR